MAQTLGLAGAGTVGRTDERRPFGLFKDLDRPGDVFRDLGPNWFASAMGTGIVANAAAVLPLQVPRAARVRHGCVGLAAAMLVGLLLACYAMFGISLFASVIISLAARTHLDVLRGASVLLFALLLVAWLVVASRTARGAASGPPL